MPQRFGDSSDTAAVQSRFGDSSDEPTQPKKQTTKEAWQSSPYTKAAKSLYETGVGALKGVAHTAGQLSSIGETISGAKLAQKFLPKNQQKAITESRERYEKAITPSPQQKLGYEGEQIGEFFLPTPAAEIKAVPGAGRLARAGYGALREATQGAIVSAAQSGGNPKEVAKTAAIGGAVGGVGGAISGVAGPVVKNVLNPVEEKALSFASKRGVRLTPGQRTGQEGLQRVEQGLQDLPGSSTRAQKFYRGQQEEVAKVGRDLAGKPSPISTNQYGAGSGVEERLTQRISRLKGQADRFYEDIKAATGKNKQIVQTGDRPLTGQGGKPIVDSGGNPITVPVMETLETPVDAGAVRGQLKPIYDDIVRLMPEARRSASPAFRALDEFMRSPAKQMNAMDFDKFMGAVKAIARDGKSEFLTSRSQGLAKQIIKSGEQQLQSALATAGKDIPGKLRSARNMVKSYYETSELLGGLRFDEPAALYQHLTTGGDKVLNTLKDLNRLAPNEIRTVGRTYLEGLVEKATKEGGFGRSAGIKADWQRLGPETKKLLFGAQLTEDLDNFMLAAKRLTRETNPSGTAHNLFSFSGGLGIAGAAIGELLAGHPEAAAGTVAVGYGVPHILGRMLFTPGGAKLLTEAITLPTGSAAQRAAVATLNRKFASTQKPPADTTTTQRPPVSQ